MLRRSPKRQHVPSKCEAGSQKCCNDLANTRLDLRKAANSLQIEGKRDHWGGRNTEQDHIYIYICLYMYTI